MKGPTILLVDDSVGFLYSAELLLATEAGIEVVSRATSGLDALKMADQLHPDLVLVDLLMPGMDGIEVTRRLKTQPVPPCVVVVTLHDNPGYRAAAAAAGADGFISKLAFGSDIFPLIQRLFPA